MKEQEILKGNKLIAEFMELRMNAIGKNTGNSDMRREYFWHFDDINKRDAEALPDYHSSWDWLMPVVEKIEKEHNGVVIRYESCELPIIIERVTGNTKIEATWIAIIKFIEWYNKNK